MALVSRRVRSTSIEAQEFRELSQQYAVSSVPKIVVNDRYQLTGALPEPVFVDALVGAVAGGAGS